MIDLYNCCNINDIVLNTNKCKSTSLTRNKNQILNKIFTMSFYQKDHLIKYLNVVFDDKMTFENQIDAITNKAPKCFDFVLISSKDQ